MTHTHVGKLIIIGSDNGLSPGWRQAIFWTNAKLFLIRTLGTKFSEILNEIHTFSLKKMHFKMSSGKRRPFCLSLNVLRAGPLHFKDSNWNLTDVLAISEWSRIYEPILYSFQVFVRLAGENFYHLVITDFGKPIKTVPDSAGFSIDIQEGYTMVMSISKLSQYMFGWQLGYRW